MLLVHVRDVVGVLLCSRGAGGCRKREVTYLQSESASTPGKVRLESTCSV